MHKYVHNIKGTQLHDPNIIKGPINLCKDSQISNVEYISKYPKRIITNYPHSRLQTTQK